MHTTRPDLAVPILTYHNIGSAPRAATHRGLYLSVEKFRFHLDMLRRHGYRGVSMDEGLPYLRGRQQGRVAIITFDDGYVDTFENALPALQEHHFTATCYLVASHLGGFNAWDAEEVRTRKPLMDVMLIRRWLTAGMKVGSHTLSHPHLSELDPAAKQREIVESKAALEERLGIAIEHFCFPYGNYDQACLRMVEQAGYLTAVTTEQGRVGSGRSLFALPRVPNSGKRSRRFFQTRALLWKLAPRLAAL